MISLTHLTQPPMACGLIRSTYRFLPPVSFVSEMKRRVAFVDARLDGVSSDSNLDAAIRAASLRFEETLRPDPLFIDPYAECLVFPTADNCGMKKQYPPSLSSKFYYRLATKFIDDKILNEMINSEELRQIVLLTDGMDTRPYRLNWPRYTIIYDISPETVFREAHKKLQASGAKVSKTSMMIHTSLESYNLQLLLQRKGFNGSKPSLWVLQFATQRCMEKLFFSHGFSVSVVNYDEVVRKVEDVLEGSSVNVLFVARQLRLSDAQMEAWRAHFERIDEDGDEEGFEEL